MACAAVIPPLNIRLASTLHGLSSIISDELQDIKQALQLVYNLQPWPLSSLSLNLHRLQLQHPSHNIYYPDNETIEEIGELIDRLIYSGTRTSLCWILSHAEIIGNEEAEKLSTIAPATQTHPRNAPFPRWKNCSTKEGLVTRLLPSANKLQKNMHPWRRLNGTTTLTGRFHQPHLLSSGHNYFNVFSHRIDTGADPSCW
jgi:hypothetical protein